MTESSEAHYRLRLEYNHRHYNLRLIYINIVNKEKLHSKQDRSPGSAISLELPLKPARMAYGISITTAEHIFLASLGVMSAVALCQSGPPKLFWHGILAFIFTATFVDLLLCIEQDFIELSHPQKSTRIADSPLK